MMEGSQGGSSAPAPFLVKTYEMVDDFSSNSVVSWSPGGQSFVVWNPPEFARDLLPKYFKHNNFSSFIRQLNTYGFRKVDPDQWEFANEEFIRGRRHLLKNIHRRKPIHSHSTQGNAAVPLTDSEREEFEKEIERLRCDKTLLQLELERRKQEHEEYEFGMRSLGQRVLNIAQRRRQLISFFGQLLQKPEFETRNKKRRMLVSNYLCNEASKQEDQFMTSNKDDPMVNLELVESLDSCLGFWENYMQEINQTPVEEICEFGVLPQPSPIITTEMPSSGDLEPHSSSSPELSGSPNCTDCPAFYSSLHLNVDPNTKSLGIDVNTSPDNVLDIDASKDQVESSVSPVVQTGANDGFWQQFLTETPGSSEAREVECGRSEIDCRRSNNSSLGDGRRPWWNMNNVDSLAKQMEHLTPVERT